MHWREKIKKAILKVEFCLQFAKDIKDVPPDIISSNDQFCKEVAREKAKREAAKQRADGVGVEEPQRPRSIPRPQMPVVMGMPTDGMLLAEEQPAVSEERAEAIRRCFQHLMAKWEEDKECPGTSALPVTADGRMCTENTCHNGYIYICVPDVCPVCVVSCLCVHAKEGTGKSAKTAVHCMHLDLRIAVCFLKYYYRFNNTI